MQAAKLVTEMLVLIHHAGFTELISRFFQSVFGLSQEQAGAFFQLFGSLFDNNKNNLQAIQTYFPVLLKSYPQMANAYL